MLPRAHGQDAAPGRCRDQVRDRQPTGRLEQLRGWQRPQELLLTWHGADRLDGLLQVRRGLRQGPRSRRFLQPIGLEGRRGVRPEVVLVPGCQGGVDLPQRG